ncbi:MAG: c-type cytochrome [Deltaproteobacteria bacterium]|nr:c-type cytochrome [Deltaproteobacteria bacterium]
MRTTHAILTIVAVLSISCRRETREPLAGEVPSSHAERVRRGEYLAMVGGCNDCHTPGGMYGAADLSRRLSGSELGWQGPWGTSYPSNLTPHMETGIGRYSEDDIVKTLRTGKRPDGRPLLPPMPWPHYGNMSDADVYALAAYLKSLPPIEHRAPASLPPGQAGPPSLVFPAPPAWDVPRGAGVGGGPPPP